MGREAVKHGSLQSSGYALTARTLCERELKKRADATWDVFRQLLDNEGFVPSEDNRGQLQKLVEDALAKDCQEMEQIYFSRTRGLLPPELANLDKGRHHALESALAAYDADVIRRIKRRAPLDEELSPPRYRAVKDHWSKALDLAARSDLPNALKEAASAVEALAQIVVGKPGTSLGEAVKQLRAQKRIQPGSDAVIEGLWTFANASPGARHGSSGEAHVDPNHWGFARTSAEGALRLLLDLDSATR